MVEHPSLVRIRSPIAIAWLAALGVAALGTWILFDGLPGINWGMWTIVAMAGLLVVARRAGREPSREVLGLLALAGTLAVGASFTFDPLFHVAILGAVATILAAAALVMCGAPFAAANLRFLVTAPFVAFMRAVAESYRSAAAAVGLVCAERSMPLMRGTAIALPVVLFFAFLLSGADPLFAAVRDGIVEGLKGLDFIPRAVFFSALATITLGTYASLLRAPTARQVSVGGEQTERGPSAPRATFADTERLIVLGSVAALFAIFLVVQASYLFGNPAARVGSGITFAEHARRGFGELSVVATACTLLIIALDRRADRGPRDATVRMLALVTVLEVQFLLASAYSRVDLYADAYGYTTSRLYAQVYMVIVSVTLLLLAMEVWTSIDAGRLTRRIAVLAAVAIAALAFWNHQAWVARQNLDRYARTGKIDAPYLAGRGGLSLNAVPTVVRALDELPADQREVIRGLLGSTWSGRRIADRRWFEWNAARVAGAEALRSIGVNVVLGRR